MTKGQTLQLSQIWTQTYTTALECKYSACSTESGENKLEVSASIDFLQLVPHFELVLMVLQLNLTA